MRRTFLALAMCLTSGMAYAAPDATVPLVVSACDTQTEFIRYDEMSARMLAQYGAVQLKGEIELDANRVKIEYINPALESIEDPKVPGKGIIFSVVLRPTNVTAGDPAIVVTKANKPSSWACWFGYSDPVQMPPAVLK